MENNYDRIINDYNLNNDITQNDFIPFTHAPHEQIKMNVKTPLLLTIRTTSKDINI